MVLAIPHAPCPTVPPLLTNPTYGPVYIALVSFYIWAQSKMDMVEQNLGQGLDIHLAEFETFSSLDKKSSLIDILQMKLIINLFKLKPSAFRKLIILAVFGLNFQPIRD